MAFPVPMVTSVCFGGDGLRDLYIVTGSIGADREDAGTIFRLPALSPASPSAGAGAGLAERGSGLRYCINTHDLRLLRSLNNA